MESKPLVSVIVPVYNAEKRLSLCIDSIRGQTYKNIEIIIINDGSSDQSAIISNKLEQIDERITVIHQKNSGVSNARNKGLRIAKGQYVMFVDSDDTIDADFIKNSQDDVERYQPDLYISGLVMETYNNQKLIDSVDYKINKNEQFTIKSLFENLQVCYPLICICSPCGKIYKKELIDNMLITFDENISLGEDTLFNLLYLSVCKNVYFSKEIYYHYYRGDDNSLFSKLHKDTYEIHRFVYGKMRNLMLENNCDAESISRFEKLYIDLIIGCITKFFLYNETSKAERKDIIKKVEYDMYLRKNLSVFNRNIKKFILYFFVKLRWTNIVYQLFKMQYKGAKCSGNRR